jgi:CheY-like chemotaxis protein
MNSINLRENKLVLIVEDNMINLMLLKTLLQKKGFEIVTAVNGVEALRVLDSYTPSVILMDINMPVMNGYEASEAIRKSSDERIKTIPIIAVTAEMHSDTKENVLNSGMNGYVPKPIDIEMLLKVMQQLVTK